MKCWGWFLNCILWVGDGIDPHFPQYLRSLHVTFVCFFFIIIYSDIASKHFRFAEMLYYKVLESVIEQEQKRLGDMDLSVSK